MDAGHPFPAGDDENVVVTAGDVTSIGGAASGDDALAAGGESIAVSLNAGLDVLSVAFVSGAGDVQILQIQVADLLPADAVATDGDVIVAGELTVLAADVISSGAGAATPVGTISLAARLSADGELSLSFVDGDGRMQLIEANVAELLQTLPRGAGGGPAPGGAAPAGS